MHVFIIYVTYFFVFCFSMMVVFDDTSI